MPQKIVEQNGVKKLHITVHVRCKDHPSGRIQLKRAFDNVEPNTSKANILERDLLREAEREKARRESVGISWGTLLGYYDLYATEQVQKGDWCQSAQTLHEAMRALQKWTGHWFKEPAGKITAADVTQLFHKMKEAEMSDALIGKVKGDIKKVYDYGMLFDHIRGIKQSPTASVSIKSRKRMRTEILREDEIKKLLAYSKKYEPKWHYIWAFGVYTGCRNGELYALKWSDIDFQNRMITVQRSFHKKDGEKSTKTGDWRHVSICDPLWEIIQDLKLIHDHEAQRGKCSHPGYVLPRPGLWQNGEQARKLRLFCEEIGITPVCFHTLRACFATELLKRGVDVPSVMRVGGWKSIKTMMHYVRLSGVNDKGITDPLDYRSIEPQEKNQALMNAVGQSFGSDSQGNAVVIPLPSRAHPGLLK